MTVRTTLGDTLVELCSALGAMDAPLSVRVRRARLDLPVEVQMSGTTLFVNPPRWRWRTDFDERPGRLCVQLGDDAGGSDDADG